MRMRPDRFHVAVAAVALAACRPNGAVLQRPSETDTPRVADASPDVAPVVSRPSSCVAVLQGPLRARVDGSASWVATADGNLKLVMETKADGSATRFDLLERGRLAQSVHVKNDGGPSPSFEPFLGRGVLGFGHGTSPLGTGKGHVVWAAVGHPKLESREVLSTLTAAASFALWNEPDCTVHSLDLTTGRAGMTKARACSWFHLWDGGISVAEPVVVSGFLSRLDFGKAVVTLTTGATRRAGLCPRRIAGTCMTFSDDLEQSVDDDPPSPESQPSRTVHFTLAPSIGSSLAGDIVLPRTIDRDGEAPAVFFRTIDDHAFAFVASSVTGLSGPHLVLGDATGLHLTHLSDAEAKDQRVLSVLHTMIPNGTPPWEAEALVQKRRAALSGTGPPQVRPCQSDRFK